MEENTGFGKGKFKIMNNKLLQNFNNQTAALIGNLNLQIANLMTENQQLQSQVQDLQTKLNMANKNNQSKPKEIKSGK